MTQFLQHCPGQLRLRALLALTPPYAHYAHLRLCLLVPHWLLTSFAVSFIIHSCNIHTHTHRHTSTRIQKHTRTQTQIHQQIQMQTEAVRGPKNKSAIFVDICMCVGICISVEISDTLPRSWEFNKNYSILLGQLLSNIICNWFNFKLLTRKIIENKFRSPNYTE